jgi:hypothetical protein
MTTSERDTAADEPEIPEGTIHVPVRPCNHLVIAEEEPLFTPDEPRQAFELVGMSETAKHYLADLTERGMSARVIVWPEKNAAHRGTGVRRIARARPSASSLDTRAHGEDTRAYQGATPAGLTSSTWWSSPP